MRKVVPIWGSVNVKRASLDSPSTPIRYIPQASKKNVFIGVGVRYNCCTDRVRSSTWSLSQMRRFLQYSLGGGLISLALVLSLLPDPATTAWGSALEQAATPAPAE